jgi:hypothetical protein
MKKFTVFGHNKVDKKKMKNFRKAFTRLGLSGSYLKGRKQ